MFYARSKYIFVPGCFSHYSEHLGRKSFSYGALVSNCTPKLEKTIFLLYCITRPRWDALGTFLDMSTALSSSNGIIFCLSLYHCDCFLLPFGKSNNTANCLKLPLFIICKLFIPNLFISIAKNK